MFCKWSGNHPHQIPARTLLWRRLPKERSRVSKEENCRVIHQPCYQGRGAAAASSLHFLSENQDFYQKPVSFQTEQKGGKTQSPKPRCPSSPHSKLAMIAAALLLNPCFAAWGANVSVGNFCALPKHVGIGTDTSVSLLNSGGFCHLM